MSLTQPDLAFRLRTFRTVRGALLWYAEVEAGPARMKALPLERGGCGMSREAREMRNATHAAIMLCLQGLPHAELLVEYQRGWRSREDMARAEGFPGVRSLRHAMRHTEHMLRERMEARGLLEEGE